MKIKTSKSSLRGCINVPSSKSHTIRALITALMVDGESIIKNPLFSADTQSCLNAIKKLGAEVKSYCEKDGTLIWKVKGTAGKLTNANSDAIDLGNSGTSLTLLTGIAATSDIEVTFYGDESLRNRPIEPLITALEKLGAIIKTAKGLKYPITVKGPICGGETIVHGISSQFVSSLLFAAPLAKNDCIIKIMDLNERPYVELSLDWLNMLGIKYSIDKTFSSIYIQGGQKYKPFEKIIPADFSTALFPLAAAAITGSNIIIKNLDFNDKQGDKVVFDYLKKMGLKLDINNRDVFVYGNSKLISDMEIDMNDIPDALPIMSVVACFAEGETVLYNVSNARIKETDRVAAMAMELKKIGADIEEIDDGLIIRKSDLNPVILNGHKDHRIIMSLAIAGMVVTGGETVVENADEYTVTYPNFIKDFKNLGANIDIL